MTMRARTFLSLLLVALLGALVFSSSASAAFPIAKDGKIYACYKAKGKGKGTLRVVRGPKARCPKKWKKTSWYAAGPTAAAPGPPGPVGPEGAQGQQGQQGERGLPGTAGNVVEDLEKQVNELLTKVLALETLLGGITRQELLDAVGAVPAVGALCAQAETLTNQSNGLRTALGGLNTIVDTLTVMALPAVPTALPAFSCPS
jgi:hypothetical protein